MTCLFPRLYHLRHLQHSLSALLQSAAQQHQQNFSSTEITKTYRSASNMAKLTKHTVPSGSAPIPFLSLSAQHPSPSPLARSPLSSVASLLSLSPCMAIIPQRHVASQASPVPLVSLTRIPDHAISPSPDASALGMAMELLIHLDRSGFALLVMQSFRVLSCLLMELQGFGGRIERGALEVGSGRRIWSIAGAMILRV